MVEWANHLFTFSFGKALVLAQEEATRHARREPNTEHILAFCEKGRAWRPTCSIRSAWIWKRFAPK